MFVLNSFDRLAIYWAHKINVDSLNLKLCVFYTFWPKARMYIETGLCLVFTLSKTFIFLTSSVYSPSLNGQKRSKAGSCSFFRILLRKSLKHWVAKWRNLKGRDWHINLSSMRDPVTSTCLDFSHSNKLLIGSWFSISKGVDHICGYGFKCLSGSVIYTDKSECIAKLRFACVDFDFGCADLKWSTGSFFCLLELIRVVNHGH